MNIINAQDGSDWKYSSGNEEIDRIRHEIATKPTDTSNFMVRAFMLKQWFPMLQQQGAVLTNRYMHIDSAFHSWGRIYDNDMKNRVNDVLEYSKIVDEGYLILDSIQRELTDNPLTAINPQKPERATVKAPIKNDIPFPQYKGTEKHNGFTGSEGPVYGQIAWQFPVGLAWESKPVIVEDKVYLSSPGMRNVLTILDINTGEILNNVKQTSAIQWDQLYSTPSNASTPVVLDNYVLYREMGARGNDYGPTKHIVYVDKKTNQIEKKVVAGHVDYRHGYAPFSANEKYLVFPHSIQEIHKTPPIAKNFNFLICKDVNTGAQLWKSDIGSFFAEPILDDDKIFIGTESGYFYCFNTEREYSIYRNVGQKFKWRFKVNGAINKKAATDSSNVYFGSNDGTVYCLNKNTGELRWKYSVEKPVDEAFRHFSSPFILGDKMFIGSADKNLYCLNTFKGKLIFKHETNDWIRSCPVATTTNVYFASINGDLYNISYNQKTPELVWEKHIGDHWIYADLTLSEDKLLLNNSDLYCYCVNIDNGEILWKHSIIKAFYKEDGYRILSDQIAGGAYYQSKATAADGKVFIGTPSRFVYALDAESGKELWKYELGAAISGAPVYNNGRIYVGQQGGEDEFYCLDAKSGKMIWTQNVGWVWGSATVSDGMVFIPGIDGYLYALDAKNGYIVWRHRTEHSTCSEPLVMDDYVYFGGWDGFMYKLEKDSGKLVWRFPDSGSDSGVAIGFDGKILMPGQGKKGIMKCIDTKTEEILWTPQIPRENFNVTPAYNDGKAFISALYGGGLGGLPIAAKIVALDARNGKPIWTFDGPGGLTGPIVGNNGYIYCGSTTNPYFFGIEAKGNGDGTTNCLFKVKLANKVEESTAAIYNGKAYILSSGGYLYAIE